MKNVVGLVEDLGFQPYLLTYLLTYLHTHTYLQLMFASIRQIPAISVELAMKRRELVKPSFHYPS